MGVKRSKFVNDCSMLFEEDFAQFTLYRQHTQMVKSWLRNG